mmetsp:Transcript_47858/g.113722  ORF Transcript_47858/g.113722 Transcript_47858/m.113722 type:complete len:204 (+) Transcript_47858:104-715(+)
MIRYGALLALSVHFVGAAVDIASEEARRQCVHWQHMSCLLDVFEKTCDEGDDASGFLDYKAEESVWLCCCPLPYKACHRSAQNEACVASMEKHMKPLAAQDTQASLVDLRYALQSVRTDLRAAGGDACTVLADGEPMSTCGSEAKPRVERSIARPDLFCEMLTWQREDLGDGDAGEFKANGCPWPKKKARNGNSRKRGRMLEL